MTKFSVGGQVRRIAVLSRFCRIDEHSSGGFIEKIPLEEGSQAIRVVGYENPNNQWSSKEQCPVKILGSQDFRHFVQPGSENELLRQFCEREILMGKFLPEFRVGTTIAGKLPRAGDDNPTLRPIDAVCVLGLPHDYHLVWLGNEGKKRMTKSRHGRLAKSEWCPSVGDKVALIEVKSGKPNHESVVQLFVYRTLYEQDYPQCAVDQLWIIALHDDPLVRAACEELGISVWTEDRDGTDS